MCMKHGQDLRWCFGCKQEYPRELHFSDWMWNHGGKARKCNACSQAQCDTDIKTHVCKECKKPLPQSAYSDKQWFYVAEGEKKCRQCCTGPCSKDKVGWWRCRRKHCQSAGQLLPKEVFHMWAAKQKKIYPSHAICDVCSMKDRETELKMQLDNVTHVQTHE